MPGPKPTLSRGPSPTFVGKTAEVARCRLDLVCDRTTDGLALRRVRLPGGAIAPTLCCEACATAANNEVLAAGRPQP